MRMVSNIASNNCCEHRAGRIHSHLFLRRDASLLGVSVLCYALNRWCIAPAAGGFFANHLNDVLGGVFFLAYTNLLLSVIGRRIRTLPMTAAYILAWGMVWEYIAPHIRPTSVCDPLDLAAYVFGGCLYWLFAGYKSGSGAAASDVVRCK